ncbi:hypothetical protein ABW19_dt0205250 [Dactylella cylindrospora]|nr:hypothetical protein ABW19_dt0205250 [Dactylella cylindrospora]
MAEKTHCLYCFDVITSTLSRPKKSPLSLPEIEEAYHDLEISKSSAATNGTADTNGVNGVNGTAATNGTNGVGTNGVSTNGVNGHTNGTRKPEYPLFVTWNLVKSGGKQLRGCIGTFEPHELEEGLRTYALTSAFDDTRFSPIEAKELSSLECGVSILTDFEPASNPFDWTLGTHGLRISFVYHGRRMGATYLPDVPAEQGWTQEETLISLMRKAGWGGRSSEWRKVSNLQVTRYKGTKESVSWGEYRELVEFLEGGK